MKKVANWYLPDNEKHFSNYLNSVKNSENVSSYQSFQRTNALSYLKKRSQNASGLPNRVAIDIGACVGLWARDLCETFEEVICFEPYTKSIKCLKKNLSSFTNFKIHSVALSNKIGNSELYVMQDNVGSSSMKHQHVNGSSIKIKTKLLDDYKFKNVDFIKIDVQEHELEVLQGAKETLKNNSPILCVECTTRNSHDVKYVVKILNFLNQINYELLGIHHKEYIFRKCIKNEKNNCLSN